MIRRFLTRVMLAIVAAAPLAARADGAEPRDLLARYVAQPPAGFAYAVRDGGRHRGAEWVELILTSQTWRGIPWRHQLYIIRPEKLAPGPQQALLFIDGGKWRPEYGLPPAEHALPKRAGLYLGIANRLAAPVVVLRQVPNQPLFGGLTEDALIAHTLEQYLRSGEPDWPLLLPMVRSAMSAMDAVQGYAAAQWAVAIEGFTVTGASKRGWTTWLAAAVDNRVRAIAPMVFDVLNMTPQMAHQRESWGVLSEQIADYSSRRLTEQLGTAAGERLAAIVDPFSYRERIAQPKIVILATNDRYWPVDSARLYWDGLHGTRYPLYLPNQGHKLTDTRRIVAALDAVHSHSARGEPLPDVSWQWDEDEGDLKLVVDISPAPASVRAWVAKSPSRDLREARWRSQPMRLYKGRYVYTVRKPESGYVGLFGEAVFGRGNRPIYVSTLPTVTSRGEAPGLFRHGATGAAAR
jgi:PhoPQ-activated pathogenicity-related protein